MMTDRSGKPRMTFCIARREAILNSSVFIDWMPDRPRYDALLAAGPAPLEQAWQYGAAVSEISRNGAARAVISVDGRPVAALQAAERRLPGGATLVRLTRGPVVREPAFLPEVAAALRAAWPLRRGRLLFWMPDLPAAEAQALLRPLGKRPMTTGYGTAWLDIAADPANLRRSLRGNWRSALVKAEADPPVLRLTRSATDLDSFVAGYLRDRRDRRYGGPTERLVRALAATFGKDMFLIRALEDGDTLAAALFLRHGSTATYFLSWTTPEGRGRSAAHLLVWTAIERLRGSGVRWMDLGGIDAHAPGVARFKLGTGALPVIASGTWF